MHIERAKKSLQATRDGWSSSAIAEDVIRPACLSYVRHSRDAIMLLKVFIILGLIGGSYTIGKAFIMGSIQLRGEKKPLRRQDDLRRFREVMGIFTVIFIIWVAILAWMFVVPLFIHSR